MLSKALSRQIQDHALEVYPAESCGFIIDGKINGRDIEGDYIALENTHPSPKDSFRIDPRETIRYGDRIVAVVHSHPDGPNAPSACDMRMQDSFGKPFVIVATDGTNCQEPFEFGDQLERLPLEGRVFRHAVADCYEVIRDYYWLNFQIDLPIIPRDWGWWEDGLDLYEDYFASAGFRKLRPNEIPQAHDCFFLCVGSDVPNHGGVYLGEGRILHHLGSTRRGPYAPSHLSVAEYGVRWQSFSPIYVRHERFDK